MIEQDAKVVGIVDDTVHLETLRQSACGSCEVNKGCGTALLADWFPKRRLPLRLHNRIGAQLGDHVVIGLDENALQRATYQLYGLPLLALLVGALTGDRFALMIGLPQELAAIVVGLLGMVVVLMLLHSRAVSASHDVNQEIRLLRVAGRMQTVSPQSLMASAEDHAQGVRKNL